MKGKNNECNSKKSDEQNTPSSFELKCDNPNLNNTGAGDHQYGASIVCDTDGLGYPTPNNLSPDQLVLDASDGFIPLWQKNRVLRWKFNENSMSRFSDPEGDKQNIRDLFRSAIMAWGDSAPIKFKEDNDTSDFEIYMSYFDNCRNGGCVLASAFFPDAGRHRLVIYPKMLTQSVNEQIETLTHEIGHIFGLRHFFAKVHETAYPSEIFGAHKPFSIMNYGHKSVLTNEDKSDLKNLYEWVWSGRLTDINGTPIVLIRPYHYSMP